MNRRRFLSQSIAGTALVGAHAFSQHAAAQAAKPANILFAISDDQSFPHASAYGCPWVKTPAFDRVAREGLLFMRAYTPNAKCAPSRACILTGRNSWQLEEACNHTPNFPGKFTSYVEALDEHGYFVGSTGKTWSPGNPGTRNGKPRQLAGPSYSKRSADPPARAMSNNDYAANFIDFLDEKPSDRPWCFWYGATEPHRAYEYGAGVAKGGKQLSDIDRVPAFWPDNETVRNDMLDYAFEVEHFDAHLGRMLAVLEARGELDNTLILVTSDNGMPFPRAKGQQYELSSHMPLAAMWKAGIKNPGRIIDDYVSFIDFAPTFLEAAGLAESESGMQALTGRSLFDVFASEKAGQVNPERDHVLIGQERHDVGRPLDQGYPIRAILKNDLLYLQNHEPDRWPVGNPETGYLNTDGSPTKTLILEGRRDGSDVANWQHNFGKRPEEELYHVARDPDCVKNLAGNPEYAAVKAELQAQLQRELEAQGDPRASGNGEVFERYPYAQDNMRGFYERYMAGEEINAGWVNKTDFEAAPLPD